MEDDGEDESDDYGGYAGVHEDEDESDDDDYLPTHFAPWIMLYSLELSCILQVGHPLSRRKLHPGVMGGLR